jgi:hypothetical protein
MHRDHSICIEIIVYAYRRANMDSQGFACTRSFYMGLASAEGQKLKCFKKQQIMFYKYNENLVNPLCSKCMGI